LLRIILTSDRDAVSMITKIISGGQTGADRAALDWAIARGIPHGGWCPKGRRAEDGAIPSQYQLTEMSSPDYPARTEQNVCGWDGTVIISLEASLGSRGTALTQRLAEKHHKPWIHIHSGKLGPGETLRSFVEIHHIRTLNVAGPRASSEPRIVDFVSRVLEDAFGS
jgi:Circularly permutated YpsA SLOG family